MERKDYNDYMFNKYSSLETYQKSINEIKKLLNKYFSPEDLEETYKTNLLIENKNDLINKIQLIFNNLSISTETLEHILNEYSIKNNEYVFGMNEKEMLYKLGINSNNYLKLFSLYQELFNLLKKDDDKNLNYLEPPPDEHIISDNKIDMDIEKSIELNKNNNNYSQIESNCSELAKKMKEIITPYSKKYDYNNKNSKPESNVLRMKLTEEEEKELMKRLKMKINN